MPKDRQTPLLTAARALLFASSLVPLLVFPGFFFPYITVRAVFFRVLVELASAIVLYLVVRRDVTFNFRRDVVFWAFAAWVGANALAAAFGVAPMRSIFGDHERMGGVWFWVHLLAYYVVLRTIFRPHDWLRLFRLAVTVASIIAAYGLAQYWFLPVQFGIEGISAGVTVGNSGLLAAYLLANIAFCVLLTARTGHYARLGYGALALLLVVAMVFSGNRSSTLALVIGGGAGFVLYSIWSGSLRGMRSLVVVGILAVVVALPFVTRAQWARPATSRIPSLSRLSSGVDSTRVIQWRAAVEGIRSRPLLGVGPENYQIVWSQYYHPEMYRFLGDARWDRAHNAYLDAFTTAGILGFLSLLAIWLALGWAATQAARRPSSPTISDTKEPGRARSDRVGAVEAIAMGFFMAYAFYLFFWFFDLNSTMLWVALAAFVASRATGEPLIDIGAVREKRWQSTLVLSMGAIALVSVLYVHGFETLRMARTLDRVRNPERPLYQTLADFESVFGSPAPVPQQALLMYAGQLRSLLPHFQEIRNDPDRASVFDRAFVLAVKEFERQGVQDRWNERVLVQHARVLMLASYYYGNPPLYESALAKLRRAVELAPRRVSTRLALGMAYLNAQRPAEALRTFESAYSVYPPFPLTQGYLGLAHAALSQNREAARWLTGAMHAGYTPDRSTVIKVARALADEGDPIRGADLARLYITRKHGPAFIWGGRGNPESLAEYELAAVASELFEGGGDVTAAAVIERARNALCVRAMPLNQLAATSLRTLSADQPDCRQPWREAALY